MQKDSTIALPNELEEAFQEIKRGCEEILPETEFRKKLLKAKDSGKPLTVKAGFDPTAPDLHLGHSVLLNKLKIFQDLGHEVHFLIGDYTGMIGDPTGRSETRVALTREEVNKNAQTYKEQVFQVLDEKKTIIRFNSEWLGKLNLEDILGLTAHYTVAQLLERDDFSKRYSGGQPISLVEFMYPLMQGYDSVAMKADVELGGTDQKFNLLVGRQLQAAYNQTPQTVITLPLLVGLDGEKKMSKSFGNYIRLKEPALEIYGKIMSISDDLMWNYYTLLSSLTVKEIEKLKEEMSGGATHPKIIKSALAEEIAARFQGIENAKRAKSEWETIHNPAARGIPDDIPEFKLQKMPIPAILKEAGMAASNSEAKRLIEGGGVYSLKDNNEFKIEDLKLELNTGTHLIRVGKRKFARIIIL